MQTSATLDHKSAMLKGRERFKAYLDDRTLAAFRAYKRNPSAIIPRKRKRKARTRIPAKDERPR